MVRGCGGLPGIDGAGMALHGMAPFSGWPQSAGEEGARLRRAKCGCGKIGLKARPACLWDNVLALTDGRSSELPPRE